MNGRVMLNGFSEIRNCLFETMDRALAGDRRAVTALESICTGQVYVPTLVLVLRSGSSFPRVVALFSAV